MKRANPYAFSDDTGAAVADDRRVWKEPAAEASFDYQNHSRSALGAIRNTLGFDVPASTESVNGRAPLPHQEDDRPDLVVSDGASWSDKRNGNADRPME